MSLVLRILLSLQLITFQIYSSDIYVVAYIEIRQHNIMTLKKVGPKERPVFLV